MRIYPNSEEEFSFLLHGHEKTLSAAQLTEIVKKFFEDKSAELVSSLRIAATPKEGELFIVSPSKIDKTLFLKERENAKQEAVRKIILKAIGEMEKNPKYQEVFATLVPLKTWNTVNMSQFNSIANCYEGTISNWCEQALEWAQRISNGESWEKICNQPDSLMWYRIVIWRDKRYRIIGGARQSSINNENPPTEITIAPEIVPVTKNISSGNRLLEVVPLVTIRNIA